MKRGCRQWLLSGLVVLGATAGAGESPGKKPEPPEAAKEAPAKKDSPSEASVAIEAGLGWLARHQGPDGLWSTAGFTKYCEGREEDQCSGTGTIPHDVGISALAAIAFLEAGHLPESTSNFAGAVKKTLEFLRLSQNAKGCFPREAGEFMYDHAIATLAMVEAARLTGSEAYRESAQRGVAYLEKARNAGFAWRYESKPKKADNDTSVTAWCMQALAAAEAAKLKFDRVAYQGVREWLKKVTNRQGVVGYIAAGDSGSYILGMNEKWLTHPGMTAAGLYMRIVMDKKATDPWMKVAAGMLMKDLPKWDEEHHTVDFYYWHYGALALCRFDGPKGPAWKAFKESLMEALIPNQDLEKDICRNGSWDPAADKWGPACGRVYVTAINVLTLELIDKLK